MNYLQWSKRLLTLSILVFFSAAIFLIGYILSLPDSSLIKRGDYLTLGITLIGIGLAYGAREGKEWARSGLALLGGIAFCKWSYHWVRLLPDLPWGKVFTKWKATIEIGEVVFLNLFVLWIFALATYVWFYSQKPFWEFFQKDNDSEEEKEEEEEEEAVPLELETNQKALAFTSLLAGLAFLFTALYNAVNLSPRSLSPRHSSFLGEIGEFFFSGAMFYVVLAVVLISFFLLISRLMWKSLFWGGLGLAVATLILNHPGVLLTASKNVNFRLLPESFTAMGFIGWPLWHVLIIFASLVVLVGALCQFGKEKAWLAISRFGTFIYFLLFALATASIFILTLLQAFEKVGHPMHIFFFSRLASITLSLSLTLFFYWLSRDFRHNYEKKNF